MAAPTSELDTMRRRRELVQLVDDAREGEDGSSASLALALHELERRGWKIMPALDQDSIDQAADQLQRADRHTVSIVRRGELAALTALVARTQRRGWTLLLDADGCGIVVQRALSKRLRSRTIRAGIDNRRRAGLPVGHHTRSAA